MSVDKLEKTTVRYFEEENKKTSEKILNKLKRKRVIGEACPPPGSRLQSWKAVTGVVHVLVNSLTER